MSMNVISIIEAISDIAQIGQTFAPAPFNLILGLISKFGAPAAIKMIEGLGKTEITEEDIRKLHDLVKPPEEYFAEED